MPVRLLLHAERVPRFTDRASREPAWKILHRLADAAYPHLHTLWTTLFADVRAQVDAAREPAMTRFEKDWGTRDVRAVIGVLRQTIPTSRSPADAARKARSLIGC